MDQKIFIGQIQFMEFYWLSGQENLNDSWINSSSVSTGISRTFPLHYSCVFKLLRGIVASRFLC